ncbi:MAG: sterol desaturase family protein [Cyanobacteria bacterium P01_D01_bin.14]
MGYLNIPLVALLLLVLGDFVATFAYHVPEHVFGRYHSLVHHSANRSFVLYSIRVRRPQALIPGFLGAFPYLVMIPLLWPLSASGTMLGLLLAEGHVIWRHRFETGYRTPAWLQRLCQYFCITTPERHQLHHRNANLAFGDIFTFYGQPAGVWLQWLRQFKQRLSQMT